MSAKPKNARRCRTRFTKRQYTELEAMFSKTKYPSNNVVEELASALHLHEFIIKTWFKNRRVRWKKQQGQTKPKVSQEAPTETASVKEEEPPLAISDAKSPLSPGISDVHRPDIPEDSGPEQPIEAGASVDNSSWDSLPYDPQDIYFPWASILCDIEQFVELYDLPGEVDPSELDRYLFPEIPRSMPGIDLQCDS